ncbi:hypothetical protein EBB79_13775 [Parasedimentitalea marina]|uniref:Uncharacterized protein n=1 Tax=Parasedimentitalea marina TaxID=2483033 RepID=A0A3T0N465_9RHOB|nr:hypothetical protein [Parasedimentitalea marina]AZV78833.1 hypothetical protein EBB79_13775 [Parasedimentitalea marina]
MFEFLNGKRENTAKKTANKEMLMQFRDNLRAVLLAVPKEGTEMPDPIKGMRTSVNKILNPEQLIDGEKFEWSDAYLAEKMLAHLRPHETLEIEVVKQIDSLGKVDEDAQKIFKTAHSVLKENYKVKDVTLSAKPEWKDEYTLELRSLLDRVLNDVHWKYAQRYHNRKLISNYTSIITGFGAALTFAFVAMLVFVGYFEIAGSPYSGLSIAATAGLLGASFSVMTTKNFAVNGTSIEEMLTRTGYSFLFLRLGVGGVGAIILYFFFEAGALEGAALPNLDAIGFTNVTAIGLDRSLGALVPNSDLSKLLVWSFAAGFSEKLVTSALGRVQDPIKK